MRVFHLITALDIGGAETQLATLAVEMRRQGHEVLVASLIPGGYTAQRLRDAGIPVDDLGVHGGFSSLASLFRLVRMIQSWKPDVVQSWLYHADLLATIARLFCRDATHAWNVRCAELDPEDHSRMLFIIRRALALLSGTPDAVVANSTAGRQAHERIGYRPTRWEVIPNAINADMYRPTPETRSSVRDELGVPDGVKLVALVARFHPMKDHGSFLAAATQVGARHGDAHFVLVGPGLEKNNSALAEMLRESGLDGRIHLLGARGDMARLQASWDVAVCSSYSEGFSNAIAEAMSCEVPCVSTDVGDAHLLMGNTGLIVTAKQPRELADAIDAVLSLSASERQAMGAAARERIIKNFSLSSVTARYLALYRELLAGARTVGVS